MKAFSRHALSPWLQRFGSPLSWSSYLMAKDGTIYKATRPPDGPYRILDLNGNPFLDAKTGRAIEPEKFNHRACRMFTLQADFGDRAPDRRGFQQTSRLYYSWRATPDTLWYYWQRYGRLVGYDVLTRRPIGSLGPDGFAPGLSGAGERLAPPPGLHTLKTATNLYQVDLEHRTTKALFATTRDDPFGAVQEVYGEDGGREHTIVVTRHFVSLLTPDGTIVWQTPYEPTYPDYPQVQVSILEPPGQFALWFYPSEKANQKAGRKLPVHVTWIARGQGVLKNADLPSLAQSRGDYDLSEKLMVMLVPPVLGVTVPLLIDRPELSPIPWKLVPLSLAVAAVLWVSAGWWLGRRYSFSIGAQIIWTIFHLLFGLAGFLAFLSVQEWPGRQLCPNCKKLRVVDRSQCEHCGAAFPPPEKTGTEIFESLATN